jgi:hypothetical protein
VGAISSSGKEGHKVAVASPLLYGKYSTLGNIIFFSFFLFLFFRDGAYCMQYSAVQY